MTKFYPVAGSTFIADGKLLRLDHNNHAKATGEFRPPRKGEWFLSGAIVAAYQARADLTTPYHIAVVVKTRTVTTIEEIPE